MEHLLSQSLCNILSDERVGSLVLASRLRFPTLEIIVLSCLRRCWLASISLKATTGSTVKSQETGLFYSQSVRVRAKSLEAHDQRVFFLQLNPCGKLLQLNPCGQSPYEASSLTRVWICLL
jgi:hypothetical protein